MWAFDDPNAGLVEEPFVCGADVIIDRMVVGIPNAEDGVTLFFSGQRFPGAQFEFVWRREQDGGNWYYSPKHDLEGWLCPALFRYFQSAPERIYVQVRAQGAGAAATTE